MTTTFAAALEICGLTRAEAAAFLDVSPSSIDDWTKPRITKFGPASPPSGVWAQLAVLYRRIEDAADNASGLIQPDLMDRKAMNNLAADSGDDPLPGHADLTAGAMALLLAWADQMDEAAADMAGKRQDTDA